MTERRKDTMAVDGSDRTVPAEIGICDQCGQEAWVWDFMGDVFCCDCLNDGDLRDEYRKRQASKDTTAAVLVFMRDSRGKTHAAEAEAEACLCGAQGTLNWESASQWADPEWANCSVCLRRAEKYATAANPVDEATVYRLALERIVQEREFNPKIESGVCDECANRYNDDGHSEWCAAYIAREALYG